MSKAVDYAQALAAFQEPRYLDADNNILMSVTTDGDLQLRRLGVVAAQDVPAMIAWLGEWFAVQNG